MQCPYCLSEVLEEALVCKTCSRDLYLFKPMMAKVEELEVQIAQSLTSELYQQRIQELELLLQEHQSQHAQRSWTDWAIDIALYLLVPLILLLLAHWVITVVYDTKMVYLRVISMVLPLPFAYILFKEHPHKILPWFIGVLFLAISSVIGMSWITSQVDHSPVWPQSIFEWREVLEYATSIAFSFLTGMLLGGVAYANKNRCVSPILFSSAINRSSESLGKSKVSLKSIHGGMKTLHDSGSTIVALGTTAISIYTGLKGILGS